MSKALVIKNADFSVNKLDTITFNNDVPCTGITLNQQTATVEDTLMLVATQTPASTTDVIRWSSSNPNVATVSGGIVTAVGNGTAVITATCGSQSAFCEITVAIPFELSKAGLLKVDVSNTGELREGASCLVGKRYITLGSHSVGYPAFGRNQQEAAELFGMHPYPISPGAKTIKVTCGSNLAPLIVYYNSNEIANLLSSEYAQDCAKVLDGETSSSGTDYTISGWTYGERIFQIPDIEGINSFTLGFYTKTADTWTNFDVENPGITIEFGFE